MIKLEENLYADCGKMIKFEKYNAKNVLFF